MKFVKRVSVVVGAQWGDEGKGKITHYLAERSDVVVRFGGGNNAGHTVVVGQELYKLHHLPSGILFPKTLNIMGNGMVIDLLVLMEELEGLRKRGISCNNLAISERAHLIMPYHRHMDLAQEKGRGERKIGTTGRGIGPAYMDKVGRIGIRVGDLFDEREFEEKLRLNFEEKKAIIEGSGLSIEGIMEQFRAPAQAIRNMVCDTSALLCREYKAGKRILFEGAQGALLDIDHGTYPFVTSSSAVAGGAATGSGFPPHWIESVLGVSKAYTTRVGSGPFPTELSADLSIHIRERGNEYGTTTGRPRRCGWLDLLMLRYAAQINGLTALAIMKLDVLTGLGTVCLCTSYRHKGKIIKDFPSSNRILSECEPVYEEMPGWTKDITSAKKISDLPKEALAYLARIEKFLEIPIEIISVGPEHDQTLTGWEGPLNLAANALA